MGKNRAWVGRQARAQSPYDGTYQIWLGGKTHAVDVEATSVRAVERLTSRPPGRWQDNPSVKVLGDDVRSTRIGDVIVDPTCGAWEVEKDGYLAVTPQPVRERMQREGIVPGHLKALTAWLDDMKQMLDAPENPRKEHENGGPEL